MIRAKFRCLHIDNSLDKVTTAKLAPVIPKKGLPNFEENRQFWEYSPSGEAVLTFKGDPKDSDGRLFVVGDFYFIDMEKSAVDPLTADAWVLARREEHLGGTCTVDLRLEWRKSEDPRALREGFMRIGMSEKADAAQASFGRPANGWAVRFSYAHGPEAE
jgi:hypothetical protein